MQTIWKYSRETESRRILHAAKQIATGFYRANHFLVLPYPTTPKPSTVIFPKLPYLSIPRFWDRVSRIDINDSILFTTPQDLVDQTTKLLTSLNFPKPNFLTTQKLWTKNQDKIISAIYQLIPSKKNYISKIIIFPTLFGTGASFNLIRKPHTEIHIYLREDQGISAIVEAILTSLTRYDVYDNLHGLWAESEIIVDWIMNYSPLSKFIPNISPTIKSTRTLQKAHLLQKSADFMARLGVPLVSPKQIDTSRFTSREKQIFQLLLSKSNQVVTFDELSATDPENFSLYAVSKTIQRLRDKLEKSGVSGSFIQTKRGEGYLLVN